MLKKQLQSDLESMTKYATELKIKFDNLERENKKLKGEYHRSQSYIKSVANVLPELKGIILGVKLPDDQPYKEFINFNPDDYYGGVISERKKKTLFTVRDEIRVRLEYIERNISYINDVDCKNNGEVNDR